MTCDDDRFSCPKKEGHLFSFLKVTLAKAIFLASMIMTNFLLLLSITLCIVSALSVHAISCPSNSQCVQVGEQCNNLLKICSNSDCKYSGGSTSGNCTAYIPENGSCLQNYDSPSCYPGLSCYDNKCVQYGFIQNGKDCNQTYQCSKGLTCSNSTNKCVLTNDVCDSELLNCPFGTFCNTTGPTKVCYPQLELNDDCTVYPTACPYGSVCSGNDTTKTCTALYSLGLGETCSPNPNDATVSACDASKGLYCEINSAQYGFCTKLPSPSNSSQSCQDDSYCNFNEICECSNGSQGKCSILVNINAQCATDTKSYHDCLIGNQCVQVNNYLNLNSCVASKCSKEFCAVRNSCENWDIVDSLSCPSPNPINSLVCSSNNSSSSGEPSLSSSLSSPIILISLLSIISTLF
ncbi:hypothetical protein DFA_01342 [Cavenderia fasciculata]|uniref:Paramecium surface antigen repeat-containing protein n=1 Tax=Cavenderia fasciculata TaxID=261658 RepID=F4PS73_CACFS|nr:uncharacterized protein DFA_01342 [Cavenderia fasciculata]EGG21456.1 hypothetical protein DFA_01342 [Cavenderia fasciculata]|eukprot:XP_004359306.1 hypothetical protein DFA_01342 [Cavenderia fasciculata]